MSYVSVVADFFSTRQGGNFTFSPEDYAAIAEWEKQEIPLAFVLSTIDMVIGESEARSQTLSSIEDLKGSVGIQFADWLRNDRKTANC